MIRPAWDFDYRPVTTLAAHEDERLDDFVLATENTVDPAQLTHLLGSCAPDVEVDPVLDWHPLYWTRVRTGSPLDREGCERRLRAAGVHVRYLASSQVGSQRLPPTLALDDCLPMRAQHWQRRPRALREEATTTGRWFMGSQGVEVDRRACGTGAGARLAVIDNDAGDVDRVGLDNHILVGTDHVPTGSSHAAMLVAWAVGAKSSSYGGHDFVGVAPDASPRLYSIRKPGNDVLSFPLAIVRAVADGADVVVCATNVDGQWSPMLDDALELASRLGRGGRGAAVVLPCSRETSSPEGSPHSSLSLGAGDPAADPRVFCIAPSGRNGGWFLWRDRRGQIHPFANRGPALRWLAPGDDIALPFANSEILTHAESSGASAIAAGVLLLVLGQNPTLSLAELEDAVTRTADDVDPASAPDRRELADAADVLPLSRDGDRHNAKHGYGRLNASRACLLVCDPVASVLAGMGEQAAAIRWLGLRDDLTGPVEREFADALLRAARTVLSDTALRHELAAILRHLRLLSMRPERARDQSPGALLRLVSMWLRDLRRSHAAGAIAGGSLRELDDVIEQVRTAMLDRVSTRLAERWLCDLAAQLWPKGTLEEEKLEDDGLTPAIALLGA